VSARPRHRFRAEPGPQLERFLDGLARCQPVRQACGEAVARPVAVSRPPSDGDGVVMLRRTARNGVRAAELTRRRHLEPWRRIEVTGPVLLSPVASAPHEGVELDVSLREHG
jgi:hypothetical protein